MPVVRVSAHDPQELWDRQIGESDRAFAAFVCYRDFGPTRSLTRVARELNVRRPLLGRWSARWSWVERCRAWTRAERIKAEEARREERHAGIREMEQRHVAIATAMQARLVERLQSLNVAEMSAADCARWLQVAVQVERLARGTVTERVADEREADAVFDCELAKALLADPETVIEMHRLLARIAGVAPEPTKTM